MTGTNMQDGHYVSRGLARIGVVVPISNTNLEPDMGLLAPRGVSVHFARAGGYDVDRIPDENQMRQFSDAGVDEVIRRLTYCRPDIILYGCTSATLAQGPHYDRQFQQNIENISGIPAVTAAGAVVEVMQSAGIDRFAFTSPYVESLNNLAIGFIESFGPTCVHRLDAANALSNEAVGRAHPREILETAVQADHADAEAVVISCTDYRAAEAVPEIEAQLGKPVITSNQAIMLVALQRLGLTTETSVLARHRIGAGMARVEPVAGSRLS